MFFANDKRQSVRDAHPELKITEVGKRLGEMWKALSESDRKKYETMAGSDKQRYEREMQSYQPPESDSDDYIDDDTTTKKRKKKQKKDPNRPKRSMSSFMFFANDKRAEVKAKYPDLKITDMTKKLAEMWKVITEDEKKKYENQANKDKDRYRLAMTTYKAPSADSSSSESDSDSDSDSS